jgi:WD40 domain-containing protein
MTLRRSTRKPFRPLVAAFGAILVFSAALRARRLLRPQLETVETGSSYHWVSFSHAEGHLALRDSSAGAFSPDSSQLAVANGDKVLLQPLGSSGRLAVLHPHVALIKDFDIQSASFLAPTRLLILGRGLVEVKKGMPPRTPELAFQWDTTSDSLSGKVSSLGAEGGTGPAHYFPDIRYIGIEKGNTFDLWNPLDGRGGGVTIPPLTEAANVYTFSPDGHWLLLAQIATSSKPNPVVVRLSEHQFVDSLPGHQGAVLSMEFSRDDKKAVTACEDGKVRVFSVPDLPAGQSGWKLLETLEGHSGPVHWAEFSADGKWLVSGGEDQTVRVWSAEDGKLLQTLEEAREPVLSVAFSPDGRFIAASTEKTVLVWQRQM